MGKLDPQSAVVIAVEVDDAELDFVIPDPSWPNPEDYDDVLWFPMDDSASEKWQPPRRIVGPTPAAAVGSLVPQL